MKKKQGFTLIELLAVIVILAVIALITTSIILGVIDKSKKGALQDSAYGLIDSANIYYAEKMLENNNEKLDFIFSDGVQTSVNKLNYKGKVENGSLKLFKDGKSAVCITEGKYVAIKNINDEKVIIKTGRCEYNEETSEYETKELCQGLQDEIEKLKRDHKIEIDRLKKEYNGKPKGMYRLILSSTNLKEQLENTYIDYKKLNANNFSYKARAYLEGYHASNSIYMGWKDSYTAVMALSYDNVSGILSATSPNTWWVHNTGTITARSEWHATVNATEFILFCDIESTLKDNWQEYVQ